MSHTLSPLSDWVRRKVRSRDGGVLALICPADCGFLLLCVQVNGLDTVRVPMSVVNFERPKTKRYKYWLAQQAARGTAPTSPQTL